MGTAVAVALEIGESVIQLLADNGAKLDAKDIAGRTPLDFAKGVFLAARPPEAKPKAAALLQKLMAKAALAGGVVRN